jgi:hypothetical protein
MRRQWLTGQFFLALIIDLADRATCADGPGREITLVLASEVYRRLSRAEKATARSGSVPDPPPASWPVGIGHIQLPPRVI